MKHLVTKGYFVPVFLLLALIAVGNPASASIITVAPGSLTTCPATGLANTCALLYRFNANGSIDSLVDPTVPSTDGIEDTLVGVLNLTGSALPSIHLSGVGTGGVPIFQFDGDGQSTVTPCVSGPTYCGRFDLTGVGARNGITTFANITGAGLNGDVVFGPTGLVGGGGGGWFVLEDQINFSAPPPVTSGTPEPGTFAILSAPFAGLALWRRRFGSNAQR